MFFPAKTSAKNQKTVIRDIELQFPNGRTECLGGEFYDDKICLLRNTFKKFYDGKKVSDILYVAKDGLFVTTKSEGVFFIDFNTGIATKQFDKIQNLPMGFTCYYNSAMASCIDNFRYAIDYHNGGYTDSNEDKAVCKLAMCGSRLIGVKDDYLLLFNPTHEGNFSENEKIQLPSLCSEIAVTASDTAYLLGDTVYKLTLKPDNSDVKLEQIACNLGETVFNTASVIDGRAVFVSKKGMYMIAANKVSRICRWLDEYVYDYSIVSGTYYDGKYYMACRVTMPSEQHAVATIVIDLTSEKITRAYNKMYDQLISGSGKLFARLNNVVYILSDESARSMQFSAYNVDFGGFRHIRALHIQHKGEANIEIRSDIGITKLFARGDGSKKRYRITDLHGTEFNVTVSVTDSIGTLQALALEAGGKY